MLRQRSLKLLFVALSSSYNLAMETDCRHVAISLIVTLLGTVVAQTQPSATAQTYKNEDIGLTYTFPDKFVRMPDNELPKSSGTERIILALWDKPRRTPIPRVVFLYDSKVQPAKLTPGEITLKYVQSLRPQAGYKLSKPQRVRMGPNTLWRMDYWRPDDSGQSYNSAIAYTFGDRTVLFVQMNSETQQGLNSLVHSLQTLVIERK